MYKKMYTPLQISTNVIIRYYCLLSRQKTVSYDVMFNVGVLFIVLLTFHLIYFSYEITFRKGLSWLRLTKVFISPLAKF